MADKERSGLEKLLAVSPGMGFRMPPPGFEKWAESFLADQAPEVRNGWNPRSNACKRRMPGPILFRGVTTNPVITRPASIPF